MASLIKYTGKYGTTWRVRWRDEAGEQQMQSFAKRSLANDFRIKLENDIKAGYFVAPSEISLGSYLDDWIDQHRKNVTENTCRSYKVPLKHIKSVLGKKPLQKISPTDIEKMYSELSNGRTNTYVSYVHRVLNIALKNAEKTKLINRNPCNFVTPPKKNKSSAKMIDPEDINSYLEAFKDHYLYIAVCLGLFCGLRNSETLALQWKNVDWKKSLLIVDHSVFWKSASEYELVPTKSKQVRTVPLTEGMVAMLKRQKEWQNWNFSKLWNQYNKSDFIVTRVDGSLIHTRYLSKQFSRRLEAAGLEHIRFHDLRHTCASLMLLEGENLKNISAILGHSTITITADTYVHIVDDMKRKAVSRLDKYMQV